MSSSNNNTAAAAAGSQFVEDDDEFQEFRQEDWTADDEDHEDAKLWQADWDNEVFDDNFSRNLRAALLKIAPVAQQNHEASIAAAAAAASASGAAAATPGQPK